MKRTFIMMGAIIIAALSITSCKSTRTYSGGIDPNMIIDTRTRSDNEYDLTISETPIQYTIDISSPEGEAKLNKLTLVQAKNLAYREAIMKYKCAVIHSPTYDYQTYGKKIIRITVYGFPAVYKNQKQ